MINRSRAKDHLLAAVIIHISRCHGMSALIIQEAVFPAVIGIDLPSLHQFIL